MTQDEARTLAYAAYKAFNDETVPSLSDAECVFTLKLERGRLKRELDGRHATLQAIQDQRQRIIEAIQAFL